MSEQSAPAMETFAKLFETPTTQVLIYIESAADEDGEPVYLRQICIVDELRIEAKLNLGTADDAHDRAEFALARMDQAYAENFVNNMASALRGDR